MLMSEQFKKVGEVLPGILSEYIDNRWPTLSIKIAPIAQTRPAKQQKTGIVHGRFIGKVELTNYSREE